MSTQKTIVVIGGTGEIGKAVALRFAANGWRVIVPARDLGKPSAQELMANPSITVILADVSKLNGAQHLFQLLKNDDITIRVVFQAAGTFLWDDGFPGPTKNAEEVARLLFSANVETKEHVIEALREYYADTLGSIRMDLVSSHAAQFGPEHPFRNGSFGEEGYVAAMARVSAYGAQLKAEGIFSETIVHEPGLVASDMARTAFPPERAGDIDWAAVDTPEEYAEKLFPNTFFI